MLLNRIEEFHDVVSKVIQGFFHFKRNASRIVTVGSSSESGENAGMSLL